MTIAPDELEAEVNKAIRKRRTATVKNLGVEHTLWLAAPPLWTRSAAVKAGFLEEPESVTEFVQQACDVGWCETEGSLQAQGPTELSFWMRDEVRGDVLDILQELVGGRELLQRDAQRVAHSVVECVGQVDLPGVLESWAKLLTETELDEVPGQLVDGVRRAVDAEDLGRAEELVIVGEALEPVLEGTAERDLDRARQVLDGGLDRREEERRLGRYLNRPELSEAVDRLLDPQADKWALHLRGVGGVGKTTLIRYLTSGKYADERHLGPFPMTCVNFDHISPDYPVRKPVQLLLELADGLAPYTAASYPAFLAMRAFRDDAYEANQAVSSLRDGSTWSLENRELRNAIDGFADVVNALGGALLILDTCEELAKWGAGSPDSPAIRATLDIVERLHEQAGSVRVLFAGRRQLSKRAWLDMRDVRGFTDQEARRYLTEFGKRALAGDLADEMIRQSRAIDDPERVHPFDLALYRAWADEEPGLEVADVQRGSDAYVDSRIIKRLGNPLVARSLPVLAVGGKCRVEVIAEVVDCDDSADLGRGLAAQEWVEESSGTSSAFVTAWPAMAERLGRYYAAPERRDEFSRVTRRFAEVLIRRIDELLDSGDADIDVDEVAAALRLTEPTQAAKAAKLWDKIAAWATRPPGRWGTVGNMTTRILGEWQDKGEWPTTGAFRAAVLAANIAAAGRRDMPPMDLPDMWAQVREFAGGHPDPARQRELRLLGALGSLANAPEDASLWDVLSAERASLMSSPEVGTAAIDCVHLLLEARHADAARRLRELLDLESLRSAFAGRADASPALAWANVADARLLADSDTQAARATLEDAERLASADPGPEPSWPHWVPPEDLLARVRIERGLIAPPSDLAVLDTWEEHAAGNLESIDGERLASLCLRLRLRQGVVDASVAQRWESADRYLPRRVATDSAHDLVPPLFVPVAEAWLSAGQPERALALLERRRSEANDTRADDATVRQAEAAIVGFARRLRLTDQRSLLLRLTSPAEYRSEAARAWLSTLDDARRAWAVIYRQRPRDLDAALDRLAGWHAWWQCQSADVPEEVPGVPWAPHGWSPERPDADPTNRADLSDILADFKEMSLLGRLDLEDARRKLERRLDRPASAPPASTASARRADQHHGLRLDLRWGALSQMRFTPPSEAPRMVAEMAFGEAELLALRLPAQAARIYWVAANAYRRCDDHIGRLLALAAFHDVLPECSDNDRASLLEALVYSPARDALRDALVPVRQNHPALVAILTGPSQDAGPWRYWAQALQRLIGNAPETGQQTSGSPTEAPAGAAVARVASGASALLRALLGALAVPLAVLLAGGIHAAFGLAAERGVGAARPEMLAFDAAFDDNRDDVVRLRVGPRQWRSAPLRMWSLLWLRAILLAVRLLRFGWPERPAGYSGLLLAGEEQPGPVSIEWSPSLHPAPSTWWGKARQAPAAGIICTSRPQAAQPWERILAASLGPTAAGRIEWVRVPADQVPPVHLGNGGAELLAPLAWDRLLREHYRRPVPSTVSAVGNLGPGLAGPKRSGESSVRVRHVIGRAVQTSAGTCMDVSGASRAGSARGRNLLAVTDLTRWRPLVVVLQAEPAGHEDAGTARNDDVADKVRLATALMDDGVPAVLLLPELPVKLAREVAQTVTAFADGPGLSADDIRVALLRPLRRVIEQHVELPVLDDIIMFLNARYS